MAEKKGKPKLTPVDDDEEEELEDKATSPDEIPESWSKFNFPEMAEEGWKPYIKTQGEHQYIQLRLRKAKEGIDEQKSLGRFTEERWQLIQKAFPPKSSPSPSPSPSPFMRGTVVKTVPTNIRFAAEVFQYYWWTAEEAKRILGTDLSFEDFLNQVVSNYFKEKGIYLAVRIEVPEPSVGDSP